MVCVVVRFDVCYGVNFCSVLRCKLLCVALRIVVLCYGVNCCV